MTPNNSALRVTGVCLLTAIAFAIAYGQAPLYYSNQNQYFLHGVAATGQGLLHEDWLANTLDPTPVFSGLVTFTIQVLHPWAFHVYYVLLLGTYAVSMSGLFAALVGNETASRRGLFFVVLLVAVHSAAARWASYRLFGQDYPWYLQAGVAGQYVLGAMFQPSAFGVLLVAAVCAFVRGWPWVTAICTALAATIHPTYLLPAALLTAGFLVALMFEKRRRLALGFGALSLLLVLPVTLHAVLTFAPTSTETFRDAQDILVNLRIPHHSRADLWLDWIAGVQIAWMVLGIILAWRTPLGLVLRVSFLLGALLTLIQVESGSHVLALLFPWRISAVLVPVATVVILSRLAALGGSVREGEAPVESQSQSSAGASQGSAGASPSRRPSVAARIVCVAALLALMAFGVWVSVARQAFHMAPEELPLLGFVERTKTPGDVYLLPVRVPNLAAATRGSLSSDFKPLPAKRQDARIIPVDLQRFRLQTRAAIFVDFKSVPYKDVDVIEWRDRLRLAELVHKQIQDGNLSSALAQLRGRGVTHLVLPTGKDHSGPELRRVYQDDYYQVYRLADS